MAVPALVLRQPLLAFVKSGGKVAGGVLFWSIRILWLVARALMKNNGNLL